MLKLAVQKRRSILLYIDFQSYHLYIVSQMSSSAYILALCQYLGWGLSRMKYQHIFPAGSRKIARWFCFIERTGDDNRLLF